MVDQKKKKKEQTNKGVFGWVVMKGVSWNNMAKLSKSCLEVILRDKRGSEMAKEKQGVPSLSPKTPIF